MLRGASLAAQFGFLKDQLGGVERGGLAAHFALIWWIIWRNSQRRESDCIWAMPLLFFCKSFFLQISLKRVCRFDASAPSLAPLFLHLLRVACVHA